MGSSAAKEMDERRMKSRMMLVKVVALMMRWQSFRNLEGIKRIRIQTVFSGSSVQRWPAFEKHVEKKLRFVTL